MSLARVHPGGTSKEAGLSLLELMIASVLGVVLVAAMMSLYLAVKRQYSYDEQLARLQENGRYAVGLLRRELRMAGFYGGLMSVEGIVPVAVQGDCSAEPWALAASPLSFVDDHPATGLLRTVEGTNIDCIDGKTVAHSTDLIVIRRTAAEASIRGGSFVSHLPSFSSRRWYLRISPDRAADWLNLAADELSQIAAADDDASLWQAVTKIFFLRNYSDPENRSDGLPVLCAKELVNSAMLTRCLVEGVENLQVELGVDLDGDNVADHYLDPGQALDMQRAVTARLHLLVRSAQPVVGLRNETTYQLGRRTIAAAGDGYLRRVFSTTVELRNLVKRPIPVRAGKDHAPS